MAREESNAVRPARPATRLTQLVVPLVAPQRHIRITAQMWAKVIVRSRGVVPRRALGLTDGLESLWAEH
jgi:hypothetical protein